MLKACPVEYPMTPPWVAAKDLWELAEQKGKVWKEEHVELLMEEFAFLKKEVVGRTRKVLSAAPLEEERFGFPGAQWHLSPDLAGLALGELSLRSLDLGRGKGTSM